MDAATQKSIMRVTGMTLTSLGTALAAAPLGPWAPVVAAVIAALGGALVAQANRAPGDVSGTDVTAVLNAARAAIQPGASLTLHPSVPPKQTPPPE